MQIFNAFPGKWFHIIGFLFSPFLISVLALSYDDLHYQWVQELISVYSMAILVMNCFNKWIIVGEFVLS